MKSQPLLFRSLNLDENVVCSAMGYLDVSPSKELLFRVDELLREAESLSNPSCYWVIQDHVAVGADGVMVESTPFQTGRTIAKLLKGSSRIALFVATAGREFQEWTDRIKETEECLDIFIVDTIGSCIAEAAGDAMERYLEKEIGTLSHSNRFSPGYCGWSLREQQSLFAMLPDCVCGISLSEDCLMYPIKSISGMIGIGREVESKVYSCDICRKAGCFQSKLRRRKECKEQKTKE